MLTHDHAEQPLGGLGIHLIRGHMTRAVWARDGEENVLTLARALDG